MTLELILFVAIGAICVLFFVNHLFFKGQLLKREKSGWLIDVAKYGIILLVLIIAVKNVFFN